MNILVLGAGVIGITTAYALARRGCKVTVIDQARSVAAGASFANGGQLSYSFVDPMASPAFLAKVPTIAFGHDPAVHLEMPPSKETLKWGGQFTKECLNHGGKRRLTEAIKLAQESEAELARLLSEHAISFRYQKVGKLVVTRSKKQLAALRKSAAYKSALGMDVQVLDQQACFDVHDGLKTAMTDIVGGVHAPNDAVGDARRFSEALALYTSERYGVKIKLNRRIQKLLTDGDQVVGARTSRGDYIADAVVVCMGASAPGFLQPYGIEIPIIPAKGYSISVPANPRTPAVSLTDLDNKIVFAKLDSEVRVAGLSDFGEHDTNIRADRVAYLEETARSLRPDIGDYSHVGNQWAGLRPMTPDGLPLTGRSSMKNLYLNTGHGMLGWTFASGSAERLAQSVLGRERQNTGAVA